jgi:hypothetical protein
MSETLHDHGGHDHGGHVHGGEAGSFGHQPGQNHGFLSHLLGTDHEQHGHHAHSGHHHHHEGGTPPNSGQPGWSSALQGLKLTDALQGINVTPNTLLLMMFLGFFGWLYVVYFIRHHDPINVTNTNGSALSATAHQDRNIVGRIKNAYPLRTSNGMGNIYTPSVTEPSFNGIPADAPVPAAGAYHLPMHTPDGLKVKTVVNR